MDTSFIFQFLKKLAANNNREWFLAHKADYLKAEAEFDALLSAIINRISLFDPSIAGIQPKDCKYRIYRDLRFSQDKTPYKIHFGGFINARGKKSLHCGYYIHLQPEESLLAGGVWCPEPKMLRALRDAVYENIDEFRGIVEDPAFKQFYPIIGQDRLRTAPKGFPKDFPYMDYLKPKDYTFYGPVPDDFFGQPDFLDRAEEMFRQMKRLNDFLDYTIDDFED